MIIRPAAALWCAAGLTLCAATPAFSQTATVAPGQMPSSAQRDSGAAFPPNPVGIVTGSGGCGVVGPGCPVPTSASDGSGFLDRPMRSVYAGGEPIEGGPWALSALNATTGPIGLKGYASVAITIPAVTGTEIISFKATTDPALASGNWMPKQCTPTSGGAGVTSATAAGQWTCPNQGELAFEAIVTSCTSCAAAGVTISKGPAEAIAGLPPYAPPIVYNANRPNQDFVGAMINPAAPGFGSKPAYSTVASDAAAYGATGLGDLANDLGVSSSTGQHGIYVESIAYGSINSGTLTTTINPYNYNSGTAVSYSPPIGPPFSGTGALSLTSSYDSTAGKWQGWQFELSSSNFYQVEGYTAPPYGFYAEVLVKFPASVSAAIPPWIDPLWITDGANYSGIGGSNQPTPLSVNTTGYNEFDFHEWGTQVNPGTSTYDGQHLYVTHHDWPPLTLEPNEIQAARSNASGSIFYNLYDGNWHTVGALVTKNYYISFIDRVEISRYEITQQKDRWGRWTLKSNSTFFNVPTAPTSTTITVLIGYIKVWQCVFATACPYSAN